MNPTNKPAHPLPWLTYLAVVVIAYGLKAHYSRASVLDLGWILEPTARLAGWLCGETLRLDADLGWMAADGSFVIAPACAGVNFLIVGFTLAVLGFAHRFPARRQRLAWMGTGFIAAYLATLVVNSLRILVAVALYQAEVHGDWLTADRAHRIAGTALYLGGLGCFWHLLDRLSADHGRRRETAAEGAAAALLVPGVYVGMTVVVPLLNGAWNQFGPRYIEHGVTVSLLALGAGALLFFFGRATCCSAPSLRPAARDIGSLTMRLTVRGRNRNRDRSRDVLFDTESDTDADPEAS